MLRTMVLIISLLIWFTPLFTAQAAPVNPELINPRLIINLPSRTIEFYADNRLIKTYPVAIGKPSTPTPTGNFYINYKEVNPAWFPPDEPGRVVPSGPYNPLGYRWIGFLPTYGVHGTNNPDSIGYAVSNGCIRMYEPDVEELFELVKIHTPLQISYERVKVGLDSENRAYLAVYPDVYGRQYVTVKDVRDKLHPHGWNSWVQDSVIRNLIDASDGKPHVILQYRNLKLNGKYLAEKALVNSKGLLLPLQPIAQAVGAKLDYDNASGQVKVGDRSYLAERIDQHVYASPECINILFGGWQNYDQGSQTLEAEILTLSFNNKPMPGVYPHMSEVPLLPVFAVASATGQKIYWDNKSVNLIVSGRSVPVKVIDGKPYLEINKVFEYFAAYVYWDEEARNIDLTYPFQEPTGDY